MNRIIQAPGRGAFLALLLLTAAGALRAEITYIHAGAVVDVIEARGRTDQAVIGEDRRISTVSGATNLPAPPAARRIDLSDQTVPPGLVAKRGKHLLSHDLPAGLQLGTEAVNATRLRLKIPRQPIHRARESELPCNVHRAGASARRPAPVRA